MKYVDIYKDNKKTYFLTECATILACPNGDEQKYRVNLSNEKSEVKVEISNEFSRKRLKKLVILLTDKCNLRCRYCYLDYGNFEEREELQNIDVDMLYKIFDKVFEQYVEGINYIQFFGGEPLIAFKEIKVIISYVECKCRENGVKLPTYGLVTNGALLSDGIMKYFKEKKVSVMVSIDGDEHMHDSVRKGINGTDTFNLIASKVKELSVKYNLMFELTLNRNHLVNYQAGDAKKWFACMKELGFVAGNVGIIEMSKDKALDLTKEDYATFCQFNKDMVDYFFEQFLQDNTLYNVDVIRVLSRMLKKDILGYSCGAGVSQFTITTDGRIIPCPKYASLDFDIDIDIWDNSKIKKVVYNEYKENCGECWAKNLCIAFCYSLKYRDANNERFLAGRCWHVKEMNRNIAGKIIEMKKKNQIDKLVEKLKEFEEKIC